MKKLLVLVAAMLMLLVSLLFSTGCTTQPGGGRDWFMEVPKVEHESRYPKGHKQTSAVPYENCVYNEKTQSYFCQLDWSESGLMKVPKGEYERRYPKGHKQTPGQQEACVYNEKTQSYFCRPDWSESDR